MLNENIIIIITTCLFRPTKSFLQRLSYRILYRWVTGIGKSGDPLGAGAGWTINEVGNWYSTQGVPLGDTQEVYDADVTAMLGGLNAALKSPLARVSLGLYICLDNLSVARNAGLTPKESSQEIFRQFREAAKGWLQGGKGLSVQWIPGHMNIEGNEIADKEVRKYAKTPPNIQTRRTQSLSSAKRQWRKGEGRLASRVKTCLPWRPFNIQRFGHKRVLV